ncbi:MAG: 16S rRNA (guanine(527)-N(7))-methyltransferase RsmG [Dissulfurispiraceae bacterium]|nr:16S rRNA (guanine(527)-N(7))-methyltransferase RsmG [Dissulfurispiraceae bacterium]
MQKQSIKGLLTRGLAELGILSSQNYADAFELYRSELQRWNKIHNITSITEDREIVIKHFLDSLLYLKAFSSNSYSLCDVGSGGGFPGLPIAIISPRAKVTLLEPSRKRVAFLRQMKRLLHLDNVEIIDCRAEELVDSEFDVVVTRATFSIADLLKKAGHLLKESGFFVLSKGPRTEDEIAELGCSLDAEIIHCNLPFSDAERNLIKIKKPGK